MPRSLQAGLMVVGLAVVATAQEPTDRVGDSSNRGAIQRVAIIGASASAGFGVVVQQAEPEEEQFAKTMLNMQDLYMAADDPHDLLYLDLSSHMFFSRPRTYGESTIDRVIEWEPDLVLGVDFLFWFVYGTMPETNRLKFLEEGLTLLDRIASRGTPMVIGEVPDLEGTESFVIGSHQIPKRGTSLLANQRINQWAARRDNVAVVPLYTLTEQLAAGEEIIVGSHQWKPTEHGIRMIAVDKLHPTFDGMICLAQAVEVAARSIASIRREPERLPPMELDRDALVVRMRVRRLEPSRKRAEREGPLSTPGAWGGAGSCRSER
ncbi:MAG: hypothetical protein VX641_06065 [Planctomycetota bacterium]|nr:hypothetical protein [Planctomycetota bacterium]